MCLEPVCSHELILTVYSTLVLVLVGNGVLGGNSIDLVGDTCPGWVASGGMHERGFSTGITSQMFEFIRRFNS